MDASEGVQAQTLANFYLAFEAEKVIIPLITKCDLPHADPQGIFVISLGLRGAVISISLIML